MALKETKLKPGTDAFAEMLKEKGADRCVTAEIHKLEWRNGDKVVAVGVRPDYGKPYVISVVEE